MGGCREWMGACREVKGGDGRLSGGRVWVSHKAETLISYQCFGSSILEK